MDRRDFLQTGAAVAVASQVPLRLPQADASVRDLCMRALSTARKAGASYADIRVARIRETSSSATSCSTTSCRRRWATGICRFAPGTSGPAIR